MALPDELKAALVDPSRVFEAIEGLPAPVARTCHALTHTTISPNVAHGGLKTNVIPDVVDVEVDIRTVPGETRDDVNAMIADALGELHARVEVSILQDYPSTESVSSGLLWDVLASRVQVAYPGAQLVPGMVVGGTAARFFRDHGAVAYGAGLFAPNIDFATFGERFHGNDERIDIESLGLAADMWVGVAEELLG